MARLSHPARAMGNLRRSVPPQLGLVLVRRLGRRAAHTVVGVTFLAATIVAFVRCGDASTSASDFETSADSGANPDADSVPTTDQEGGPVNPLARVLVVAHAAPDTFDFRLCFGLSDTPDGANAQQLDLAPLPDDPKSPMPQANYPGIGRGNGAVIDPDLGAVREDRFVVPYLVNAFSLATRSGAPQTCKALFECSGAACIKSPQDFLKLPAVPATDFTNGGSRLLAVVGTGSAIEMKSIALDGRTGAATSLQAQFTQLSSSLVGLGNVSARYGSLDGGADSGVSLGSATFGAVGSPTGASITPPAMAAFGSNGIIITSSDGGALLKSSLAEIQQASDPSRPPDDFYKNRTSFVFVLVGDPAIPSKVDGGPNPEYGARGLHVVALRSSAIPVDGGTL